MVQIKVKAISLLEACSVFIGSATWFSAEQKLGLIFVSSLLAWLCYIYAHKSVTGELVHSTKEQIDIRIPENFCKDMEMIAGILLMVVAFPLGILGVNISSFPLLLSGTLTFVSGYSLMHIGMTGEIL